MLPIFSPSRVKFIDSIFIIEVIDVFCYSKNVICSDTSDVLHFFFSVYKHLINEFTCDTDIIHSLWLFPTLFWNVFKAVYLMDNIFLPNGLLWFIINHELNQIHFWQKETKNPKIQDFLFMWSHIYCFINNLTQ